MFHGPVRAVKNAGLGVATVKLSYAAWKEGAVAPATGKIRLVKSDNQDESK